MRAAKAELIEIYIYIWMDILELESAPLYERNGEPRNFFAVLRFISKYEPSIQPNKNVDVPIEWIAGVKCGNEIKITTAN